MLVYRLEAEGKGRLSEYELLSKIEERGIKCIKENRHTQRPICANLDFYSGFIYEMIGIPRELYMPILPWLVLSAGAPIELRNRTLKTAGLSGPHI